MGHRASGDMRVEVGGHPEESILILINHCREMKQQEARLRTATLLLLLSCAAICLVTNFTHSAKVTFASDPAFSAQKDPCPTGSTSATKPSIPKPLRISLRWAAVTKLTPGSKIKWETTFVEDNEASYNATHAIVIPKQDIYFVYLRFALKFPEKNQELDVKLQIWNSAYNTERDLIYIREGSGHNESEFRTVYMGQLLDLSQGDHLSVLLTNGHELIYEAFFGAFQT